MASSATVVSAARVAASPSASADLRARAGTSWIRLAVLLLGPSATFALLVSAAERSPFPDSFVHYALWVAVLMWSPLPFSFPAVLLDHDRDTTLAGRPWLLRAVALVPWMLVRSPARVAVAVSLLGWAALVVLTVNR